MYFLDYRILAKNKKILNLNKTQRNLKLKRVRKTNRLLMSNNGCSESKMSVFCSSPRKFGRKKSGEIKSCINFETSFT